MKRIVLSMAMMATVFGSAMAQKVKGSDTCLPLIQKEAEVYMKEGRGKLTVTGGGSGIGFAALIEGSTDIAMASRMIKFDEKMKMQNGGRTAKQVVIARDALSIVVNPSNKVANLTRNNWRVFSRERSPIGSKWAVPTWPL